jgi:hypothetical protein
MPDQTVAALNELSRIPSTRSEGEEERNGRPNLLRDLRSHGSIRLDQPDAFAAPTLLQSASEHSKRRGPDRR